MLIYFGSGERRYGENPMAPHLRRAWEFQAVLSGRIGLLLPEGPRELHERRLWVFPPGHMHGWTGEKGRMAKVAVFHFLSAPEILNSLLNPEGYIEIDLKPPDVREIRRLAGKVSEYWNRPAPGMMLCYEYALAALGLMACEALTPEAGKAGYAQGRVHAAVLWYAERMEENPAFSQMARAVGVSPAHLRRLFHEVLGASPSQVMDQLRFQRAMQLMSDPAMKLEAVGYRCGFTSASVFSRAFKTKYGCSPQAWLHA